MIDRKDSLLCRSCVSADINSCHNFREIVFPQKIKNRAIYMSYTENYNDTNKYRQAYLEGLESYEKALSDQACLQRDAFSKDIFKSPESYRIALQDMLGFPLNEKRPVPTLIRKELITTTDSHNVYRIQLSVFHSIPFYGLYFQLKQSGKFPLIISQHGGLGTPELCSGIIEGGSQNYNDMTQRLLRYRVNVFAPLILVWKGNDGADIGAIRNNLDIKLKNAGSSIQAVESAAIMNAIDWFSEQDNIDEKNIGMVGLSYGGLYTLIVAALDTRIKAAISCSAFGQLSTISWSDWSWKERNRFFGDAEIAALCWPRYLNLFIGNKDELFSAENGVQEYARLKRMAGRVDISKHIRLTVFEGVHEFCPDAAIIKDLMRELNVEH